MTTFMGLPKAVTVRVGDRDTVSATLVTPLSAFAARRRGAR
jgi:hypothetical protein